MKAGHQPRFLLQQTYIQEKGATNVAPLEEWYEMTNSVLNGTQAQPRIIQTEAYNKNITQDSKRKPGLY